MSAFLHQLLWPGPGDADVPTVTQGWVCSAFTFTSCCRLMLWALQGGQSSLRSCPADKKPQCSVLGGSELARHLGEVSGGSLALDGCPKSSMCAWLCSFRGEHPVLSLPLAEAWGTHSGGWLQVQRWVLGG